MVTTQRDDQNLKTFNTAKKFADEILFPIMFDFKKLQRQANFGNQDISNALELTEEIRDIQRVNGLKGMIETVHDLLYAISSTIRLNNHKQEVDKLKEYLEITDKIKDLFYNRRDRFFNTEYKAGQLTEKIDRKFFEQIKDAIDILYQNTEILMTKNKLLFADGSDEYLNDEEIKEQIKTEYINN